MWGFGKTSAPTVKHLTCSVEFAAGSNKRWPEAVVSLSTPENWFERTPPEAELFPLMLWRLIGLPDAWDRYYGHAVAAALIELLDFISWRALESEEKARSLKSYGLPTDAMRIRAGETEEQAVQALLSLVPERVEAITGPSYACVTASLITKKDKMQLDLQMPRYEPETRKRRSRPEKSLVLGAAALVALVEAVSMTADYEVVVVPTMKALRRNIKKWPETHD
jgi:hypothetical protein